MNKNHWLINSLLCFLLFTTSVLGAEPLGLMFDAGKSHLLISKDNMRQLCIAPNEKRFEVAILISIPPTLDKELDKFTSKNKGKKLIISFDGKEVANSMVEGHLERQFFITGVEPKLAKKIETFYKAPCLIKTLQ